MVEHREEPLPPPAHPTRPARAAPADACDCHAHVMGPLDRFPLAIDAAYGSPDLPAVRYLAMLDDIGFARGVAVTPSAYGTDNRALEHALAEHPDRLRGIAVLAPETPMAVLTRLAGLGVRGARFAEIPGYRGVVGFAGLARLAGPMRELGWHAQVWARGDIVTAHLPRLMAHGLPVVVDHMGLIDTAAGLDQPAFQALRRALGAGRIWIKLTPQRLSKRFPDHEDVRPFHQALVHENPDNLIWGSDWPHVNTARNMPDAGHLLDLFDAWTGDDALRRKILAENPARLYGFS